MKKVLLILLAAVFVVGLSLVGCTAGTPTAPDRILIGLVRELDHPDLAVFDWIGGGPVYRWYAANVNADKGHAGKIHLSAYDTGGVEAWVPIELKIRTFDMTNWITLAQETTALIDSDKVDFLWGAPGTDTIYTQAPICNAAGKLLITLEGGASKMIWESPTYLDVWPYVWVSLSFSNWYQLPVLQKMLADKLGRSPKAYVTGIGGYGSEHGLEYIQESKNAFGEANVIDAGLHDAYLDAAKAQAVITAAKTALGNATNPNYDIFCAFTYPANVDYLTTAAMTLDFNPPAMVFGPGANMLNYGYTFPDTTSPNPSLVEGILCFAVATPKTVVKVGTPTMTMPQLFDTIKAQITADQQTVPPKCAIPAPSSVLLDYWGIPCYTAALEMWKYAVESVGDLKSAEIRNALAAFNPTNPAKTVFGDTWFKVFGNGLGGGVLDYKCHTGEIGQWQNADIEIVGYANINNDLPNYCVTADFKFPMTNKWGWLTS